MTASIVRPVGTLILSLCLLGAVPAAAQIKTAPISEESVKTSPVAATAERPRLAEPTELRPVIIRASAETRQPARRPQNIRRKDISPEQARAALTLMFLGLAQTCTKAPCEVPSTLTQK